MEKAAIESVLNSNIEHVNPYIPNWFKVSVSGKFFRFVNINGKV